MTVFKKSLLTLSVAALGFSVVLIIISMVFMNALYYEINTIALKNTANTLLTAIGADRVNQIFRDHSDSQNLVTDIKLPVKTSGDYRLTLIAPSGYVLWDSHVTDRLVNHLDREEIIAALHGKEASSRRISISTGDEQIYYALPVMDGDISIGVFRLSVIVPRFGARVSPIILPFIIFSFLLAIIVFWAIYVLSRSLGKSVGRLVTIAQSSAPLLSGAETDKLVAPEFRSLEKAMHAMTIELTMRFEQAKAEGAKLQAILNGMSEAVFAMDSALKLHLVNPRAKELFNIPDFDNSRLSLLEATRSSELEDIAKKAIVADTSLEMELTLRIGASSRCDIEQNFQVYAAKLARQNENDVYGSGVILVLQNITRLVKLERIRKDFVANVSHELRTPIQVIQGFAENLLDSSLDDKKEISYFVGIIKKNAENMETLTNDLLTLVSLDDESAIRMPIEVTGISYLINEAVDMVALSAKNKNIAISISCPSDLSIQLYSSLFTQALVNLLDNSIKYSKDGTQVFVKAFQDEGYLVIEVKDEGIGIADEHIDRIFERFYRVDKARSRKEGGTGLGLAIVRHITLLHNGTVEVESRVGEGSIFRIKIPAVI